MGPARARLAVFSAAILGLLAVLLPAGIASYGAARGTAPASWPDNHGFLGKPADPVTGLTIVGARAYDPGIGRFLSADPILNPAATQTLNGYSYTADDPVSQADPSGLMLPGGAQCGIIASEPCQGGGGGGGGHHNPGGGGPGPGPGSGCDPYIQICGGGQGSGGQGGGGQPYCPPQVCRTGTYAPAPDLHPAAAPNTPAHTIGVWGPGCNPWLFKDGACPSERGAAGTTPGQVRTSLIGAGVILASAVGGELLGGMLDGLFGLFRGASTAPEDSATVAGVGARDATVGATTQGQRFVRLGARPQNLKWTFEHPGGTGPGTYAVPEDYFNSISHEPAFLKDIFDLPDTSLPQYFRILEPPTGTPIQYGTVPGGEFGGSGGAPEVFFPKGF